MRLVECRRRDGGCRLPRNHAVAIMHALHALDDCILPKVVGDAPRKESIQERMRLGPCKESAIQRGRVPDRL